MVVRVKGLLARFAVESKKLNASEVKPKLFEPNRKSELSVSYIEGLECAEISQRGVDVAKKQGKERLYGWAEISEETVLKANLTIDRDDDPPGHANIIDWPEKKDERIEKQIFLAQNSEPIKLPTAISVN